MITAPNPQPPLLDVRGIRKTFKSGGVFSKKTQVVAAEDVSFRVERGEALALVGESGSGKSTIARLLLRLETADAGRILLDGDDVFARKRRGASLAYRRRVQMVFQDPFGSLNPVHDIEHHLVRPLIRHGKASGREARARAINLLRTVGLEPAEDFIDRHPYELSGGQRQRVAIARALAVEPDVLVADEPTSMLDVSIRMEILNLLAALKRTRGLAIVLITHDLASARFLADRVMVLYRGRIVEDGLTERVIRHPSHPYTRALLTAIASADAPDADSPAASSKEGRSPTTGCPFVDRCDEALDRCHEVDPEARFVDGVQVRCHLYPPTPDGAPGSSAA